jgi:hypothetical protein
VVDCSIQWVVVDCWLIDCCCTNSCWCCCLIRSLHCYHRWLQAIRWWQPVIPGDDTLFLTNNAEQKWPIFWESVGQEAEKMAWRKTTNLRYCPIQDWWNTSKRWSQAPLVYQEITICTC